MTNDLVAWLGQQFDEDERIARASGDRWQFEQLRDGPAGEPGGYVLDLGRDSIVDIGFMDDDVLRPDEAAHIARHDPARVLREVDAKRRLLERYADVADRYDPDEVYEVADGYAMGLDTAVRILATAYADREGFREEWRPEV